MTLIEFKQKLDEIISNTLEDAEKFHLFDSLTNNQKFNLDNLSEEELDKYISEVTGLASLTRSKIAILSSLKELITLSEVIDKRSN